MGITFMVYFYSLFCVKGNDTRTLLIEIYNRSKGLAVVIHKGKDFNCIGKMKIALKDALNEEFLIQPIIIHFSF